MEKDESEQVGPETGAAAGGPDRPDVRARALHASEERYRTLLESMDEGFCVIEILRDAAGRPTDYRFLEVNAAFEMQTGLRGAVGRRIRELVPDHEEHWFEVYGRVAETGVPVRFEQEAAALGRYYDAYAFRLDSADDGRVAILFRDVAERRRAEEALREADRRKDEFLAMLSHELRNPLAALRNGLSLVARDEGGREGRAQTVAMMERQLGQIVRVLDDLLDVSRVGGGRLELRRERVDLAPLVRQALEPFAAPAAERAVELLLPAEPHEVQGDAARLVQVFSNLLSNAFKFTDPGGRVAVRVARADAEARVTVEDDGLGMTPEEVAGVLELGARGRDEARARGGLGIGLTLVQRLVELHGGAITLASAGAGRGCEVVVRLPLAAGPPAPLPSAPGRDAARAAAPLRLLVVDDDADVAESLALLLGAEGHAVRTAHDGEAAVRAAAELAPDAVLLDIGLPKLDGYEVARRIRAAPGGAAVALVALTGHGREVDRQRAAEAGFDRHLLKPADPEALARLLEELRTTRSGERGA